MTTYKFASPENKVVLIIDDDGISRGSCSVTDPNYLAWSNGGLNVAQIANEVPLSSTKADAYIKIDEEAYKTRLRFITPNKDSTYLAKSIQVDAYIAAGYPTNLTNFGYIKAEVARLGLDSANSTDLHTAADGLVTIRNQWLFVDALIEEIALVAKTQVYSAADVSQIVTIVGAALISFEGIN